MSARRLPLAVTLILVAAVATFAPAEPPAEPAQQPDYLAEVTGNDVYVRAGASSNYYPVSKLNAGNRITVVGQEGEWLAIEPPDGCYSLISETYVDTGDGAEGVVNGNNVRVYAGSLLTAKMYAIQLKLSRGAEVSILGREENGYYRIIPPAGAKLWMHSTYVERVPAALLELEAASQGELPAENDIAAEQPVDAPTGAAVPLTGEPEVPSPAEVEAQIADYRQQIKEIDAELKAELAKPLFRRELAPILERFAPLVEQETDAFARAYARTRSTQIADMIEIIGAVQQVRNLGDQVKSARQEAMTARANIRPTALTIKEGFDAEGELRFSAVYDSPAGPQRYRLVDPAVSPVRTLGYVEIPRDTEFDVEAFVGRRVAVRAREVKYQTGEVNPIAIYVAADIVALDPPSPTNADPANVVVEHP